VGLGKTIEAGPVLSELRAWGMADRALVLTPAGLVEQWRKELERKFALTTYYDEAVRSLRRRLDTAPPEQVDALATRISGTKAERDRRLAEIAEKYQARTTLRTFRLHVLAVPVMRLPVDVRRGDGHPLVLDWISAARTFAGIRCPHCAGTAPLVAAKTRFGCEECLAKPDRSAAAVSATFEGAGAVPAGHRDGRTEAQQLAMG
jgi:hypothetical protein